MDNRLVVLIGLVRDFLAACIGLLIAFNVPITEDQRTGLLLVAATGLALAVWVYNRFNSG